MNPGRPTRRSDYVFRNSVCLENLCYFEGFAIAIQESVMVHAYMYGRNLLVFLALQEALALQAYLADPAANTTCLHHINCPRYQKTQSWH